MALPHQSIATINSPEFINLQPLDINPLMSACEIKVLYIGENRNRSYITKEVAIEMSKTLRGAPIVGYYKETKQDFADHGEQVILDDEGVHFNTLTKPYGFVAPDAKVWFQKFEDVDQFGNSIEREYLMTTGYLWTGQFTEVQSVIDEGKPQSMELDDNSIDGYWATNVKNNMEFFIINDAIFTKLCILGNDTEPCFEGASITKPDLSVNFSHNLDDKFTNTLFSMLQELKDALKGGKGMEQEVSTATEFEQVAVESSEPVVDSTLETSDSDSIEQPVESFEMQEEVQEEAAAIVETAVETEAPVEETEFAKKEEESESEDSQSEQQDDTESDSQEDDDEKKKYSLLEQQYTELQSQYDELKTQYDELVTYKEAVENEKKDALIEEFYMLSDEDKKDIIENKAKYTLDEIKAKLAVICYEKKVNFNSESSEKIDSNIEQEVVTLSYTNVDSNLPDWVNAVKQIDN